MQEQEQPIADLGNEPPLIADGRSGPPDRREVSARWLSGTFLTGVTSSVLMGVALFAALDGREQLATPPEIAKLDSGVDDDGEAIKTTRLSPPRQISRAKDRRRMELSTVSRVGDRDVIRTMPFVQIKMALAAGHNTTRSYPSFDPLAVFADDEAGPYVASVPADYGEKAKLERMSFTSVSEMLAERFHMDEGYLKTLNPGANFGRPGTVIKVANIGVNISTPVVRIVADKGRKQVRAYDAAGKLVALYPATIGSADTPSPSGNHTVARIALNPEYTYNPKLNFKQGNNDKVLTIPPGPNGPVGSVWIALSKPTYGIHGTPEPSKIGKTESNGCVRLTNWDAQELAKVVKEGVAVEFVE